MCNYPSTSSSTTTTVQKQSRNTRRQATIPPPPPGTPPHQVIAATKLPAIGRGFLEAKLTNEILDSFQDNSHQEKLQKTEQLVKDALQSEFPGIRVWSTGSFPAGVDLHNSDLDLTVKLPELSGVSGLEKLMGMKAKLEKRGDFQKCWVQKARVSVLQLKVAETGVEVDVTVDNEDGKRNTMLLVLYGQIDSRFQLLCRAVKAWSKSVGVEGAKNARLNSFSLCLLVILYLQRGVSPAILPNLQELFPEINGSIEVADDQYGEKRNVKEEMEKMGVRMEANEMSIGALFVGFLKFWSEFDFTTNWISIRHAAIFPKRRDEEGVALDGMPDGWSHICIQDPFISPSWNCGHSTWDRATAHRLHAEFQWSLERIQKTRSMFGGHLMSAARRRIDAEGRTTDARILERREQMEAEHLARTPKEVPEGWDEQDWIWQCMMDSVKPLEYEDPKKYWDLEKKHEIQQKKGSDVKPWPEAVRCGLP